MDKHPEGSRIQKASTSTFKVTGESLARFLKSICIINTRYGIDSSPTRRPPGVSRLRLSQIMDDQSEYGSPRGLPPMSPCTPKSISESLKSIGFSPRSPRWIPDTQFPSLPAFVSRESTKKENKLFDSILNKDKLVVDRIPVETTPTSNKVAPLAKKEEVYSELSELEYEESFVNPEPLTLNQTLEPRDLMAS